MKLYLVYQAGIANVFDATTGIRKRVLQGAFTTCEMFARGAAFAGAEVETMACNMAGDITDQTWTFDLEAQPFCESFRPVFNPPLFADSTAP